MNELAASLSVVVVLSVMPIGTAAQASDSVIRELSPPSPIGADDSAPGENSAFPPGRAPAGPFLGQIFFVLLLFAWWIPSGIVCYHLADQKGYRPGIWTAGGLVPIVGSYFMLYLVGATDRTVVRRLDALHALLAPQPQDPASPAVAAASDPSEVLRGDADAVQG